MNYTIRQVSEKTMLKAHSLRYYEKEGLLSPITRGRNGVRAYTEEDLERLGLICCLKNTGMSIRQIRRFMDLHKQGDDALQECCRLLADHKTQVQKRIVEMQRHLEEVSYKIEYFQNEYERYQEKKRSNFVARQA